MVNTLTNNSIAYTYAKHFLVEHQPDSQFFQRNSIHLHVPEGAIPKDGPSAGITICTSLLSLAMGRTPVMDVAMTGELTLTGLVLKIGGVKEKIMAAKRSGFANVILPAANRPDYEDLEPYVKAGLQVHFVETYEDVAKLVFG
jgi:ATP-dependent Lon protease